MGYRHPQPSEPCRMGFITEGADRTAERLFTTRRLWTRFNAFPDRQGAKLQKALRRWLDKDLDGQCHAALAYIAEQDGRTEEAGRAMAAGLLSRKNYLVSLCSGRAG